MALIQKQSTKFGFLCWLYCFFSPAVFAQVFISSNNTLTSDTVADVANNLGNMNTIFNEVFTNVFYVIGIAFVTASLIRYREHRINPSQTPISRVLFLLLCGLAMGFCPWIIQFIGQRMNT